MGAAFVRDWPHMPRSKPVRLREAAGQPPRDAAAHAEELITEINIGTEAGKEAINKLRIAQDKNINEDYREYLMLKIQALEKYVEAFEERRQAAILLRDGYDPKDAARRDQVVAAFKERDEKFKEIMEEARKSSEQANQVAKDSLNRRS